MHISRRIPAALVVAGALAVGTALPQQTAKENPLSWAYSSDATTVASSNPPGATDTSVKHVADSNLSFTLGQVHDHFNPADWHPDDHAAPPEVVARGRQPSVTACALCHYANGQGRPQNAALAGLSVDYFTQQMMDFKDGDRRSSEPRKANTKEMIAFAKAMSDAEIKASAGYFNALPYKPWIRVMESDTAPKTRIARGMIVKVEGNQTEPLGNRIIELPVDAAATRLHDDHSGFIAYVPQGSIAKGAALASGKGGNKAIACIHCHGGDLQGLGDSPPLAGRSPSYLARQIRDFQTGARNGFAELTPTMVMAVDALTPEEIVDVAAYLASLPPAAPQP